MYRLQMNMAAACVAAVIGGMLSGCALVAQNKAMSDSPDAAAAVKDIESGSSLKEIATKAPREDARIAAASKMEDEWPICCIVMDKEQTRGVRLAAFGRLVKLGKATDHDFEVWYQRAKINLAEMFILLSYDFLNNDIHHRQWHNKPLLWLMLYSLFSVYIDLELHRHQ